MATTDIYERLAEHLDQGIIGSPGAPSLTAILEILFPEDEAEIALGLPMMGTHLSDLKAIFPDRADTLEETLERMARRGTVYASQKSGQERKYRLLPPIPGWAESPFWAGRETADTQKLAPLWLKYREEAFGAELARGNMPIMRVVPVHKSVKDTRDVLPLEGLKPRIEEASFRAVGHCPCRLMKKVVGEGCDYSRENCLHFGAMGRYMVEYGMAREITAEDTLHILDTAREEGLVHIIDNVEGHMSTICNCCGCCCVFLQTKKMMGLHTISTSNYLAEVDADECAACGTCEDRCPMEAIAVRDEGVAAVDGRVCIGCGVCTPTCPNEAVTLDLRREVMPTPELSDFLAARFKGA
jgi:NAD-dependent dihydropyrimidine dehydrogenase PreA subunit